MKRRLVPLAVLAAMPLLAFRPAVAATDPAVFVPIDRLVAAIDAGDGPGVLRCYGASATVIDEFAPFVWAGRGAAAAWLRAFGRVASDARITRVRVRRGAASTATVDVRGRAYVVVPATYRFLLAGRAHREDAAWTFVLVLHGATWSIAASTWATRGDTLE